MRLLYILSSETLFENFALKRLSKYIYHFGHSLDIQIIRSMTSAMLSQVLKAAVDEYDVLLIGHYLEYGEWVSEAVENVSGEPLVTLLPYQEILMSCYCNQGERLSKSLARLAMFPKDAVLCEEYTVHTSDEKEIQNWSDRIPAVWFTLAGKVVVCLGDEEGMEMLAHLFPKAFNPDKQYIYKLFGLTQQEVLSFLQEVRDKYKKIADFYVSESGLDCTLSIVEKSNKQLSGLTAVVMDELLYEVHTLFQRNVYAESDICLEQCLFNQLNMFHKKLCVAESLTGGLIVEKLVSIPGSSSILHEGLVTYANESKQARLFVKTETLEKFGAVSVECAYEMVTGLLSTRRCDIAIATTGIAGPTGDSVGKPLGLTYIGIGTADGIHVFEHVFEGDRTTVRESAANAALFYAILRLRNGKEYQDIPIN